MNLRLIALAALAAAGSAHALTPVEIDAARTNLTLKEVFVSGASAQRLFIGAYAQSICKTSDFDVFMNVDGTKIGNNHRAYSCTLNKKVGNWNAGTPVVIYKRDQGGSGQGVFPIQTAPGTAIDFMNVSNATCVATANPRPATDILKATFTCGAAVTPKVPHAGVSDVEPAIMVNAVNGGSGSTSELDIKAANLALMGIVVNRDLYRALQEQQGIIAPGGAMIDVPADQTAWTAADKATIPSLPASFITAALAGKLTGAVGKTVPGWDAVISTAVDANVATKQVNVCRREIGSGTQAAAQLYFLNNPISSGTGILAPAADNGVPIAVTGGLAVKADSSSGNLIANCIGAAQNQGAYALGILSRENNPRANNAPTTANPYRFVKIDGMVPHPTEARSGGYNYLYAATMQFNKTNTPATSDLGKFIIDMRTNAGKPSSMAVFDIDNKVGYLSLPSTYTGLYSTQTDPNVLTFGAQVERVSAPVPNSKAPLRMVK